MFKRLTSAAVLAACLISATNALAVKEGQTELTLGIGSGIPVGDFGDVADPGFLLAVGAGYNTSSRFTIGGELNFSVYNASSEAIQFVEDFLSIFFPGQDVTADIQWGILQVVAYGKYLLSDGGFAPYLKGRAGYYGLTLAVEALGQEASETDGYLGVGGGLGAQYQPDDHRLGVFGEGLIHHMFGDDGGLQFFELKFGVNIMLGSGKSSTPESE